ncbi:MAG: carboxypeptidase regulatory-like domain-containing protein [Isosphaerales bacterium]
MNSSLGMSWSSTALAFGLDLATKATAILVIVLLIQNVLGRRRALLGSAVGNAGLIGLLLLPFSAAVLPSVPIACLPPATIAARSDAASVSISPSASARPRNFAEDTMPITPAHGNPSVASRSAVKLVRGADLVPPVLPARVTVAEAHPAASTHTRSTDWAAIAIAGYAIAVLVLIARMGTSLLAVARLRRSCVKVDDTEWTEALERWQRRLGIGRDVVLAWSPGVSVPVVLGWLRPTVVLPSSLAGPDSRGHADAVLLHELSHVRRGDYPWNLLLRFVQALYWPHVLVWLLGRAIVEVRERACDELCVHEMGGPSAYRETLLAVASGMVRRPGPALGLAMARPSKLGRRLAQIERSNGDDRCLPRWPARLAIATMAITVASVIGAIQLVRTEARATTLDDPPKAPKAADPAPPAGNAGRVFHLQVVAADTGEPVPDADVRVWMSLRDDWRKTDAQGRLDITHSTDPSDRDFSIDVWGKGRAMQRRAWGRDPNKPIPEGDTIKLQPGETLGGFVQDEVGRPIAGATIFLWSHNYKKKDPHELLYDLRVVTGPDGHWQTSGAPETTGEMLGFRIVHPDFLSARDYSQKEIIPKIADLRASKAVTIMKKGVPIEGRVVDADGKPVAGARVLSADHERAIQIDDFAVSTDAGGRFRTGQVNAGEWFLVAIAKGHAPGDQRVKIGAAVPQVEITLGRPRTLKGRVVDPDGKPVAGAFVNPDTWRGHRCLRAFLWTDADGRFRWDDAPNDELIVDVNQTGYRGVFQQHVAPSSEDVVFTLKPSLRIQGTVRDAETKKRVDNATVEYSAVDPKSGEPLKWTSLPELGYSTGVFQGDLDINFPVTADAYKFRGRSPGFQTFVSRTFRREEKAVIDYDIALVPGTTKPAGAVATVLRPDGKPLAGARLLEIQSGGGLSIQDGVAAQGSNSREDRTGPDGTFAIPDYDKPWFVLILGDDSYALANKAALEKSPKMQAKPYAQVEGQYLIGRRSVPNQELHLDGMIRDPAAFCTISLDHKATTDPEGRFTFKNVVPDTGLRVLRRDHTDGPGHIWSSGEAVRVEPGATAHVMLGGKGRPIIGRIEPPEGWTEPVDFSVESEARLESNRALPEPLRLFRGKTSLGAEWNDWMAGWSGSPEGREYASHGVSVSVGLAPDGSFRIDDVPQGEYRLAIRVNGKAQFHVRATFGRDPGPFGRIVRTFTVPAIPGGRSDEPLNLGVMRLRPRFALKAGAPAPAFEVTTVEGKRLAVPGDFQGKFLLIDFGPIWNSQAGIQITRLNDVNQKFGKDPRLAILSLTFAADNPETRKFIEDKGEPWRQAIVGPLSNPISLAYAVDDENVPATILIGPDGKVVAKDLWYHEIGKAVGEALGRADK